MSEHHLFSVHDKEFLISKCKNFPVSMSGVGLKHYHNTYEIFYLTEGDRYYFINNKRYHITAGDMVLINTFDIHYTAPFEEKEYERYAINFKKEFITSLSLHIDTDIFYCFNNNVHVVKFNEKEKRQIEILLEAMLEKSQSNDDNFDYLKTSLLQLLMIVSECTPKHLHSETVENVNKNHQLMVDITHYINNNFHEDITLESISKKFFVSTYYFSRTFKNFIGSNFKDYLNNVRISEAQKLLIITDLNITELSEKVGFKSTTHFGKVFKKIVGVSPAEFKKQHKYKQN